MRLKKKGTNSEISLFAMWKRCFSRPLSSLSSLSSLGSKAWAPLTRRGTSNGAPSLVDMHDLDPRTFLIVEVKRDRPGVLGEILELFTRSAINMTHIESRFKSFARDGPSFHIDFQGSLKDMEVLDLMKAIKSLPGVYDVSAQEPREVPWFPMNIRELDLTTDTLDGGTELINEDHPGFHDPVYRDRRTEIVSMAKSYRHGDKLPRVRYTEQETKTWQAVYERLHALHDKWACREYREMLPQMEKYCGYAVNNIPQLPDISDFLQQRTGFTLRPISGLLSARDFLNALAFRVSWMALVSFFFINLGCPEEQLCSRCFYFNGLAPALALGSPEFRSPGPEGSDAQEEVLAEQIALRDGKDGEADESKDHHAQTMGFSSFQDIQDRFPRPVPTFLLCVVTLQICIFCFTLVANGGPEDMSSGSIGPSYDTLYRCGGLQLQGQKQGFYAEDLPARWSRSPGLQPVAL
eukprot:s3304_g4.t1